MAQYEEESRRPDKRRGSAQGESALMAPVAAKEEAKVEQPIGKQLKNADLYEISNEEKKEKRRSNEGRKLDLRNLAAEPLLQDAEPAFEVSPMAGSASLLQSVRKSANEGLSVIDEQSI